jgi:hypothetical protein
LGSIAPGGFAAEKADPIKSMMTTKNREAVEIFMKDVNGARLPKRPTH